MGNFSKLRQMQSAKLGNLRMNCFKCSFCKNVKMRSSIRFLIFYDPNNIDMSQIHVCQTCFLQLIDASKEKTNNKKQQLLDLFSVRT